MEISTKILKKGSGLPLVFLHGFLGTAEDWEPVCSFLPNRCCIGLDLPGHGDSPFVEEWEIDIPRFHLIGYSMGGRIALGMAAKHPKQVVSLTLISTHPGLTTDEEKQARWKSDRHWADVLKTVPIDDFLQQWYNQGIFKGFKPDFSMRRKQNIPGLAAALMHYSLAKQPFYTLEGVLVGERDEKFRSLHKKGVVIPRSGHMIHLENPAEVAKILQNRGYA
ncbi:MAG: alpha/beta fold hydrolase [Chlamydiales bacterium]